jgi:hypothetical protein
MAATPIDLHSSGAETASGAGAAVDVTNTGGTLRLTLDVTDSSEVQNVTSCGFVLRVETSEDPTALVPIWRELLPLRPHTSMTPDYGFARGSHVHAERLCFVGADRFVRARWEILGNAEASATFSVSGEVI